MSFTQITARITDQVLTLVNIPLLASGSEGVLQIRCEFDASWNGYGKAGVFYRSEAEVYHVPLVDGVATVPTEVLTEEGYFYFGIMGTAENTRTTEVLKINLVKGAITTATATPAEPTPDIYKQLLTAFGVVDSRVNELVAMRSAGGSGTYNLSDEYISGTIKTNGTSALIEFTISEMSLIAGGNHFTDYCILPELAPLGPVYLETSDPDLNVTIERETSQGWARILIENVGNAAVETYHVNTAWAYYPLASVSISELADARVDVEGKRHATAGAAVRSQAAMAKTVFDMTLRKIECVNLLPPTFTSGSLEDDGVTPKAASSSATSEFFPVEPGKKIAYTRMATATTRMIDGPWSFFFYDANKTVVSIVKQSGALLPRVAVETPENAAYARIIIHSSLNSISYQNMVEYTEDGTTISAAFVEYFEPYYERVTQSDFEGKNICVFGDSLAANGNGGIDTWIQRVADSLGCSKAYNRGASGSRVTNRDAQGNPAIRYAYIDSQGEAYHRMSYATQQTIPGYTEIDASGCSVERANTIPTDTDVVIVLMGANDVGSTTLDYFKEDYRTMLDNIQARVPSAEIYLCTMPFHVAFDTGASADTYEKYRQSIRNAGLEYGYPVIDLKAEMQVNKNNYTSFMDADNIHYNNAAGRNRTTKTVKSALLRFS